MPKIEKEIEVVKDVKDEDGEIEEKVETKKFVFRPLTYKDYKAIKRVAGENKELFQDMIIQQSIVEPKISIADLDNFHLKTINEIGKVIAELQGVDIDKMKDF